MLNANKDRRRGTLFIFPGSIVHSGSSILKVVMGSAQSGVIDPRRYWGTFSERNVVPSGRRINYRSSSRIPDDCAIDPLHLSRIGIS